MQQHKIFGISLTSHRGKDAKIAGSGNWFDLVRIDIEVTVCAGDALKVSTR